MSTASNSINDRLSTESNFIEMERQALHLFSLLVRSAFGKIGLGFEFASLISLGGTMKRALIASAGALVLSAALGCAGGNLTTREKGAGIGALGGAAAGGIIGAAVGHPGAGAAIGGA
jgi:hypothetical protein